MGHYKWPTFQLMRWINFQLTSANIVLFPEIEDRTNLYSSSTYEIGEFVRHYQSLPDEIYPEDLEEIFNKLSCYQATEEELEAHKQEVRKSHANN